MPESDEFPSILRLAPTAPILGHSGPVRRRPERNPAVFLVARDRVVKNPTVLFGVGRHLVEGVRPASDWRERVEIPVSAPLSDGARVCSGRSVVPVLPDQCMARVARDLSRAAARLVCGRFTTGQTGEPSQPEHSSQRISGSGNNAESSEARAKRVEPTNMSACAGRPFKSSRP